MANKGNSSNNNNNGRNWNRFGRGRKVRQAQKAFDRDECQSLGLMVSKRKGADGEIYHCVNNFQFLNGYLVKTLALRSVIIEEKIPPMEELQKFALNSTKLQGEKTTKDYGNNLFLNLNLILN